MNYTEMSEYTGKYKERKGNENEWREQTGTTWHKEIWRSTKKYKEERRNEKAERTKVWTKRLMERQQMAGWPYSPLPAMVPESYGTWKWGGRNGGQIGGQNGDRNGGRNGCANFTICLNRGALRPRLTTVSCKIGAENKNFGVRIFGSQIRTFRQKFLIIT